MNKGLFSKFIELLFDTTKRIASINNLGTVNKQQEGVLIQNKSKNKKTYINIDEKTDTESFILKPTRYKGISYMNINPKSVRRYNAIKTGLLTSAKPKKKSSSKKPKLKLNYKGSIKKKHPGVQTMKYKKDGETFFNRRFKGTKKKHGVNFIRYRKNKQGKYVLSDERFMD